MSLEALRARREAAHLERMRWDRLIVVQADLAQHPEKLASSVDAAAKELHDEGRSLAVEGVTMGLSSACETASEVFRVWKKDWRTAKKLADAAAAIDATQKVFIEGAVRDPRVAEKADAGLEKAVSILRLAAREAPDKESREQLEAVLSIGEPGMKLLSGLIRDEERPAGEKLQLLDDTLRGIRALMLAHIQHRNPREWIEAGKTIAQRFPQVGKFAGAVTGTGVGLSGANFLNNVASACVGGYAWREGYKLEELADDLRADQQHAAMTLQVLLPHARKARASAIREEARLDRMIQSMERGYPASPPQLVPPSRRVLDDGAGIPSDLYSSLPSTMELLRGSPAMTYHLTRNEVRRQEEIARAERAAAEERERAARLAVEQQQRDAARREREAERSARREQHWSGSGEARSSGDRDSSSRNRSYDTRGVEESIQRVVNNVLPNW
jgi:hypothetical protein